MEDNKELIMDIDPSKFEFVNKDQTISDTKFDTKPIGYFRDAMRRFRKNKGSVVGGIIILLLVLFAIIVPFVSSDVGAGQSIARYAKKPPRLTWAYGLANGSRTKEHNESMLMTYYGMGVEAEYRYDFDTKVEKIADFEAGKKSYYQPVISTDEGRYVKQGNNTAHIYNANVDEYLAIGVTYYEFTKEDYEKLLAWQKQTGYQVILPMIDTNSPYCFDPKDANVWYRASTARTTKGKALDENGKVQSLDDPNFHFVDIYLRDAEGNPQFYTLAGGGTAETASRKTRILYYNYYRYLYNAEPNYIFGTDSQGFDLAYRMATGMRLSFLLAICVSTINFVIGAIYGAIEGYYGGATDLIMERITDILVDVPFVVVATLFQLHLAGRVGAFPSLLFAFVMTGWIGTASRVRSQFYRFKNSEYVLAARTLGARDRRIMWKHIFPNTLGTIITSSVLVIPGVIFSESMLSYLGIVSLGSATQTSLGTLLSEASGIWVQFPHLMIFPAIVISLLMICFNLFGNGLRDAFNPTLRGVEE